MASLTSFVTIFIKSIIKCGEKNYLLFILFYICRIVWIVINISTETPCSDKHWNPLNAIIVFACHSCTSYI